MDNVVLLSQPLSFEWDEGNDLKNWIKHGVAENEAEEAFEDEYKIMADDDHHSQQEQRHRLLGRTYAGRLLFIAFTIRADKIRVISARTANRKEAKQYEETNTSF